MPRLNPRLPPTMLSALAATLCGCAGPSHIMGLPSTIPSELLGVQGAWGGAPESGHRTNPFDGTVTLDSTRYNTPLASEGIDFRYRLWKHAIIGVEADYNVLSSAQISTSFSLQPFDWIVASAWTGIDVRAGSIGGLEAMVGGRSFSAGCGTAIVRNVSFIDYSWGTPDRLPSTWDRHTVPYARVSGGWNGFELDLRVGKTTRAWQPWMWQAGLSWHLPEPQIRANRVRRDSIEAGLVQKSI